MKSFFKLTFLFITVLLAVQTSSEVWASRPPKRILIYGDSNTWGWRPVINKTQGSIRYLDNERWPGVMQHKLGKHYTVEVDGLSGRTLNADYFKPTATLQAADFNGENLLKQSLAIHTPLDLIIFMLGTNDIRDDLNRSTQQIEAGLSSLIQITQNNYQGIFTHYPQPQIMVVVPPPITTRSFSFEPTLFSPAALVKSQQLGTLFAHVAQLNPTITVIDAKQFMVTDGEDGIHFSKKGHAILGRTIAKRVKYLFKASITAR